MEALGVGPEPLENLGRIYLRYKPDESGLAELLELQEQLSLADPTMTVIAPDKLHLTLLHLGNFEKVYEELCVFNPDLDPDEYRKMMYDAVGAMEDIMPPLTEAKPLALRLYGAREDVLGLAVADTDKDLRKAQRRAASLLQTFIQGCGLARQNASSLMRSSPNFRFAHTFQPHISLFRRARHLVKTRLPQSNLVLEADYLI